MKRFIVLGLVLGVVIAFNVPVFAELAEFNPSLPANISLPCYVVVGSFYQGLPSFAKVSAIQYDPRTRNGIAGTGATDIYTVNGLALLALTPGKNWRILSYRLLESAPLEDITITAMGSCDLPNLKANKAIIIDQSVGRKLPQ